MQIDMRRYRWLLLIACLAAVAIVISWWELSKAQRFSREQHGRIRLGMTPAEVAALMGGPPNADPASWHPNGDRTGWAVDAVDYEDANVVLTIVGNNVEAWSNGSVHILVMYHDGKVIWKGREVYQPWWKIKAREWLHGLAG
jgi:hypothetical protein